MNKKIYSLVILLALVAPVVATAEEGQTEVHGSFDLGGRWATGDEHNANFQEFRDLDDSLIGGAELDVWRQGYHFQFDAKDPGAEDQSFGMKGGKAGVFSYHFAYDELPHNYLVNAVSPAVGIGGSQISFPAVTPPVSAWHTFDYSVEHSRYGGGVEVSLSSPFYVRVGADKQEASGLRPYSVSLLAEVPEPVDNSTDTLHLTGGYLGEALSAALSGEISSFSNNHPSMLWNYPDGSTDLAVFSPDNDYGKLGGDLSWRGLPLTSVVNVGASLAHLSSSYTASDINFDTANPTIIPPAYLPFNRLDFAGDIETTTTSIVLNSQPLDKLNSKLYYRYFDRDDQSSRLSYTFTPLTYASNAGGLLSYQKDEAGLDLGYRLPAKTKVDAGYGLTTVDRSVPQGQVQPTDTTRDDIVYLKLKNSALDWLVGKVGYKHLERDSGSLHRLLDSNGMSASTPSWYMDQSRDEWQLGFELSPLESLDLGLDFTHRDTDYAEAVDALQADRRHNVYFDATWRTCQSLTLTGFVGLERVDTEANRVLNTINATGPDYKTRGEEDFWSYGLSGSLVANEQLSFKLSWLYQDSDGSLSLTNDLQATALPPSLPGGGVATGAGTFSTSTNQWDDYTKQQLEAKAVYAVQPKLTMTLGYLYEKFDFADASTANYQYSLAGVTAYYSGLGARQNYDANVGYLMATYGF